MCRCVEAVAVDGGGFGGVVGGGAANGYTKYPRVRASAAGDPPARARIPRVHCRMYDRGLA